VKDFCQTFGEGRRIAICRELTKTYEEILRLTLGEAVAYYEENEPRGEYVLVVEGATETDATETAFWSEMTVEAHVAYYMEQGRSKMDAIKQTAKDRGVHKNEIYQKMI
jgi:16S rRNA (cytidine1402-2'-O)-methyltransferase